jgi:small subunit ribosomal protein S20
MAEEKKEGEKKKARVPTAKKRAKQAQKRQLLNSAFKSKVSTAIRSYKEAVAAGNKEAMKEKLNTAQSLIDKGVKTGKFSVNKAARTKSRLAHRLPA